MIWEKENICYKLAALTNDDIVNAEKLLKVKLPEAYIKLMFEQNGGTPYHQAYPCNIANGWANDHVPVDHIFGIGEEGILQSHYLIKEWDLPSDIVIFSGDGHGWLAMDYRQKTKEPPIIWIEQDQNILIEVARDFSSFIEGLYTASYEEVEVEQKVAMPFSYEKVEKFFEQDDPQQWVTAFNMLYDHITGNENYIEQKIIQLLSSQMEQLKHLAVHYTMIYNERFSFSESCMQTIYHIMEKDVALSEEIEVLRDYLVRLNK